MYDITSPSNEKKALVVEGGAMRGIFSAGVLDYFLIKNYYDYDFCIGVSAGSTNLTSWLCKQKERNYKVYTKYSIRRKFISIIRFLCGGHALDLDWLWEVTINEIPLDLDTFENQQIALFVVTMNLENGEAMYIKGKRANIVRLTKASSSLPFLYRKKTRFNNIMMSDGGMVDSIPVIKAYEMGARDITVVLSRPIGYRKKKSKFEFIIDFILRNDKILAQKLKDRWISYNKALDFIINPPKDCIIKVIAPPDDFKLSRMTTDINLLDRGYRMGIQAAKKYLESNK
ncbi:MAG: patatin family protein [Candidatus Delongbacteria bacterium]|nr:patatin family protein [Candidatus Delongbacteria bacterium]MBN2833765.1 patatin family protein [Candidatus Delongbacteria bacterium]